MITLRVPHSLRRCSPVVLFTTLLVLPFLSGCGVHTQPAAPAPTVSVSASPTSIQAGASSTLTVAAAHATSVKVTGSDGSSYTLAATGGTQSVAPAATTTYTATANGDGGTKTATVTVTVGAAAGPTVSMTASPTSISAGTSSTLTVTASNATAVTISGSDGSSYTLAPTGGTQSVTPAATTTYTATATGAGGNATATATVTVTAAAPPTVTITANPATIKDGAASMLTVVATGATTVTVSGSDSSSFSLAATGGSKSVNPSTTTTYTATATGPGGTVTATATVTVTATPPPTISLTASPTSITAGGSSVLTASATEATAVVINGSDGTTYTLPPAGGPQSVTPAATTTYTATATGPGGSTTSAPVTITVTANPPPTVSITASPSSVVDGSSSTLTVAAVNATQVTITGSDGTSYPLQPSGGTQAVTPTATTTYTATAVGAGGTKTATTTVTVTQNPPATVTLMANPAKIVTGNSSTLTVTATDATSVTVTGTDGSSYNLDPTGGTQTVSPTATTTYTATAVSTGGNATASATVEVTSAGSVKSIDHVILLLQENHTFDNYFGMLNPYRKAHNWDVGDDGKTYTIDGIDDKLNTANQDDEGNSYKLFKLASSCVDDMSSDWLASYGNVNRYDFSLNRKIKMDGYVHDGEGFAKSCSASGNCSGTFTDLAGRRVMGYYDETFLNYYYYMASQFAVSDRWFSPVSSKSITNRIASFTGGTTGGLVKDPGNEDKLPQLAITNIFQELDQAKVSWKIYYTVTQGFCLSEDDCNGSPLAAYPATDFSNLSYSYQFLHENKTGTCTAPTQPSSVVGDKTNSFCVDPNHVAPLSQYYTDLTNNTLPSFAFIEAGYGNNDEHPGSGQSVLAGQVQMSKVIGALMNSESWKDSVFFLAYDEGGGPYDHVPPVPGHSNDFTDTAIAANYPDISSIAVNADNYKPCAPADGVPTLHCDLRKQEPGVNPTDAPAINGFKSQLGFRVPNIVISPFARKHYVSHVPMDHTAILKFVENRFVGPSAHLTPRDSAQPDLMDFFDFDTTPWSTPPTPPAPVTNSTLGRNVCTPASMGP